MLDWTLTPKADGSATWRRPAGSQKMIRTGIQDENRRRKYEPISSRENQEDLDYLCCPKMSLREGAD